MKQLMQRGLRGVPKEQQELLMRMVEKNPELFQQIALEVKEKIDKGTEQQAAVLEVMTEHKEALEKLLGAISQKQTGLP